MPRDRLEAEITKKFLSLALKLKPEEIDKLQEEYGDFDKIPDDKIEEIAREQQRHRHRGTYAANGNGKQIVVAVTDMEKYLKEGYVYVATLPTNQIILEQAN